MQTLENKAFRFPCFFYIESSTTKKIEEHKTLGHGEGHVHFEILTGN